MAISSSNPQNGAGSTHTKHEYAAKIAIIQQVLDEQDVDLWKLRGLALSEGGLVNGAFLVPCFLVAQYVLLFCY